MQIEQLDLETRSQIYGYTKKVLRKYQKGISTGKLTADKFASNILVNESLCEILDPSILQEDEFKDSYTKYIDTLIKIQNENFSKNPKVKIQSNKKPTATQKVQLRKLLMSSDYTLCIPDDYLNSFDIDSIIKYITTGCIDVGNEKIYKYVSKSNLM